MKYKFVVGNVEKEIPQELAEAMLNAEGMLFEIQRARDLSFGDVFGSFDKDLKEKNELKFVDFSPSEDVSADDTLYSFDTGILHVVSVEPVFVDGKLCALRAYVSYPPTVVVR